MEVGKVKDHGGGQLHCLAECLFDPGHRNNEAAIGQTAEGKLYYQCFHNSCKDRIWAEARQIISGADKLSRFIVGGATKKTRKKKGDSDSREPPPLVTGGFSRSDLGNARRLVAMYGKDLRYCYPAKRWYHWRDTHWRQDDSGEVVRRAKESLATIYQEAMEIADWDERKKVLQFALTSEKANRIKGMICLAESEPGIPILPAQLNADPWLFNCANGTIDLRNGELQPHRREDLITCLSPVAYDPEAAYVEFERFIYDVHANNDAVVYFLQNSFGYALTGDCREQCFWFFWGSGANGKGTLLNIIREIMGTYAIHISTETLLARNAPGEIRNDIAQLDGPRFVTASEIDKGRRLGESLVKELTGQDPIRARFLYGDPFQFIPQFKLFVNTNNKPTIRDQSNAIWRRLKMVRFGRDYRNNPDGELPERLRAEMPGILLWMVQGCLNWQKYGHLWEPEEVIEATEDYRAEMDLLRDFIEEMCIVGPGLEATSGDLYKAYGDWAKDTGLDKKERLYQRSFGLALGEQGFVKARGTGGVRLWRGIALRSFPDGVT